jgi:hypothetical protein
MVSAVDGFYGVRGRWLGFRCRPARELHLDATTSRVRLDAGEVDDHRVSVARRPPRRFLPGEPQATRPGAHEDHTRHQDPEQRERARTDSRPSVTRSRRAPRS